jgi:uncharacterized protein
MLKTSIITLGVKNLTSSKTFYQSLFQWNIKEETAHIIFFDPQSTGGTTIALYPWEELAKDALTDHKGSGFRGVTLAHNTLSEDEVVKITEKAQRLGAKLIKEPQKVFWGGFHSYISDLDGHLWEICWNPFWNKN